MVLFIDGSQLVCIRKYSLREVAVRPITDSFAEPKLPNTIPDTIATGRRIIVEPYIILADYSSPSYADDVVL